jgi:predicted SAM-dependent methyltransferase
MKKIEHIMLPPRFGQRVEEATGLKKLAYKLLPAHILSQLWFETQLLWRRLNQRGTERNYRHAKDILLNVGCGKKGVIGWVNMDAFATKSVNCVYDCRKSFPFPDECARAIFCEHFFEHLDYTEEVPHFLSECFRVLRPGGVLRIIVPDAERYLRAYVSPGWTELDGLRSLDADHSEKSGDARYHTKMEVINEVFRQAYQHKFAYDYETIEFLLKRYGFGKVAHQQFNQSFLPELCLDHPKRALESLYVEGQKAG